MLFGKNLCLDGGGLVRGGKRLADIGATLQCGSEGFFEGLAGAVADEPFDTFARRQCCDQGVGRLRICQLFIDLLLNKLRFLGGCECLAQIRAVSQGGFQRFLKRFCVISDDVVDVFATGQCICKPSRCFAGLLFL